MNFIAFLFALEIGFLPLGSFVMYEKEPAAVVYRNPLYVEMDAEIILLEYFYIGGSVKPIMFKQIEGYMFDPQATTYGFKAGLRVGIVDVFFRHYCHHPVIAYMNRQDIDLKWEGGYSEVGIRIEGRID